MTDLTARNCNQSNQ